MEGFATVKPQREASNHTERQSSIEFFRIVTMLLIVAHHYVVNSGLTLGGGPIFVDPFSWRSMFLLIFGAWGKIGINCFVLITGYFMCKSKITLKKFAKLFFEVMFYRIVLYVTFWITGYRSFSFVGLVKVLIPIMDVSTGFTNAFILFYLFIPFLTILVKNLNERQHIYLIIWCVFIYVLLGTIPLFSVTMNYVSWFSVLFVFSSYIRLYPKEVFNKARVWGWMTVLFIILSICSVLVVVWIGKRINRNMAYIFVSDSNTFLAVSTSVCAFLFFLNSKINYSKAINTIATSTFGVFLIHTRGDVMRQWLWVDTLDVVGHYNSKLMPLHAIGSVLAIFIICTVIDQIRIRFIEKPFFRLWDKHSEGFVSKYKKFESKLFSKIGIHD